MNGPENESLAAIHCIGRCTTLRKNGFGSCKFCIFSVLTDCLLIFIFQRCSIGNASAAQFSLCQRPFVSKGNRLLMVCSLRKGKLMIADASHSVRIGLHVIRKFQVFQGALGQIRITGKLSILGRTRVFQDNCPTNDLCTGIDAATFVNCCWCIVKCNMNLMPVRNNGLIAVNGIGTLYLSFKVQSTFEDSVFLSNVRTIIFCKLNHNQMRFWINRIISGRHADILVVPFLPFSPAVCRIQYGTGFSCISGRNVYIIRQDIINVWLRGRNMTIRRKIISYVKISFFCASIHCFQIFGCYCKFCNNRFKICCIFRWLLKCSRDSSTHQGNVIFCQI